jgi:pimeloyl-ACP methyl ester carboxylesterase
MVPRLVSYLGILTLAVLGGGCGGSPDGTATTRQSLVHLPKARGPNPVGVKTDTVCFSVHNPGDPVPIPITATRFSQRSFSALRADDPVILLLHGAVETRAIFDGGEAGIAVASSFARRLAKEGYLVVTVDRAGYGDSPYERGLGAGFSLTFNSYVEMTHEIVTQLHEGSYTAKVGSTCGGGAAVGLASSSVILAGHSIAGGESMLYAARYHDIDALISLAWNNTGLASIPTGFFVNWIVPQFLQGFDYVTFFRPGPGPVSSDCVLGFFSRPLADTAVAPRVIAAECANENLKTAPSGELAGTAGLRAANLASLEGVGPTPALLAFADLDTMVVGENNPVGDPDYSGQEVSLWQQRCNCDVSSYTQPRAGHAMFLTETMPELVDNVARWLASRDLHPR